jgi:hypothetical protein
MKAKLLLIALCACLLIPALAAAPMASASPISTSYFCNGVDYPTCFPGPSCQDKCCYCECRAEGINPSLCSFECCLGH